MSTQYIALYSVNSVNTSDLYIGTKTLLKY